MITLTTDIGWEYAAQMKGEILSLNPNEKIIDITHSIQSQNIRQGAFVLYSTLKHYPYAIHIAVVDPGVGTNRNGLIVECEKGILIGPDNGILIPVSKILGMKNVYKISYNDKKISNTFHGRDIFAPIAAKLSLGEKIEKYDEEFKDYKKLDFGIVNNIDGNIIGKVIFTDNFGNLITNIPKKVILNEIDFGEEIHIEYNKKIHKLKFLKSYGYAKKGEILTTISSSEFFEISCNMGNASKKLKLKEGDEIILKFN